MKRHSTYQSLVMLILFGLAGGNLSAAPDLSIRPPVLDAQGRFWVYRNGPAHPRMPFAPYGWMSDATNLSQIIQVELECNDRPNAAYKPAGPAEKDQCIRVKLTWNEAAWASVAFISGPDKPAWWGETNRGRYYNLGALPKKKLVYFARGENGGETIKVQLGVLGNKPFGDSLTKPLVSDEVKLTQEWVRHELDLKEVPHAELTFICNGFGVTVDRSTQPASATETQFYIDDVSFE